MNHGCTKCSICSLSCVTIKELYKVKGSTAIKEQIQCFENENAKCIERACKAKLVKIKAERSI